MMTSDCGVVIVAAGMGARMGGAAPKQIRPLAGRPLVLWSASFFDHAASVREIVIVAPPGLTALMTSLCVGQGLSRLRGIVAGGPRRQDSVQAGVAALSENCRLVAVHDAARPFPPVNFEEGISLARESGAAIFGHAVTDTLKTSSDGRVTSTMPRAGVWAVQTPQIFRREVLVKALKHCRCEGIEVTDDAAAVEAAGGTVCLVHGSRWNLKLTFAEDWPVAEALAHSLERQTPRPEALQP